MKQATQLEFAGLPVRTWKAIHKKIVKLHEDSSMLTETGQLANGETIENYLERNPEAAAMELSYLGYSLRQMPQKEENHCSGLKRLNIATLFQSILSNPIFRDV